MMFNFMMNFISLFNDIKGIERLCHIIKVELGRLFNHLVGHLNLQEDIFLE